MLAVDVLRGYDAFMETFVTIKRRSSRQENIMTLLFLRDKDRQKMKLLFWNGDDKPEMNCYHETCMRLVVGNPSNADPTRYGSSATHKMHTNLVDNTFRQ